MKLLLALAKGSKRQKALLVQLGTAKGSISMHCRPSCGTGTCNELCEGLIWPAGILHDFTLKLACTQCRCLALPSLLQLAHAQELTDCSPSLMVFIVLCNVLTLPWLLQTVPKQALAAPSPPLQAPYLRCRG